MQFDDGNHLLMGGGQGMLFKGFGTTSTFDFGGKEEGTRAWEKAWDATKRFLASL